MKTRKLIFLYVALMSTILFSCKSKDELMTLSKCEFRVVDAENITLGGVPIEGVNSLEDLNPMQIVSLGLQAEAGSLPLQMNILVEIRNPNSEVAALDKAEWILIVDDFEMTRGTYQERIEIPAHNGIATASVPVSANIVELLAGASNEALMNLALNLSDLGEEPSRIIFRVKPYIMVRNRLIPYPNYIDISTDFTSGEK